MSVVVSGRVLDGRKHVVIGLTAIYGVGRTCSKVICDQANVPEATKVADLSEEQLDAIRAELANFTVEGDLRREKALAKKRLMEMGCVRGRRLRVGLPVRGQRTKTNGRTAKKQRRGSGSSAAE